MTETYCIENSVHIQFIVFDLQNRVDTLKYFILKVFLTRGRRRM